MTIEFFILLLIGFILLAGLIAAEARDLLSSVIAIGAAGFALSVVDLLLGAPDLAFPQVLVEIVTVVLLIRMIMTRKDTSRQTPRDTLRTGIALLGGGIFIVAVYLAASGVVEKGGIPPLGQPVLAGDVAKPVHERSGVSADYLERCKEDTGAANVVTGILLDYRAYDTLGEATVIFVAVLGGYAVLRRRGRKKKGEVEQT